MRLLIQRVKEAKVTIAQQTYSEIGSGLLLFLGIHKNDDASKINWLVNKVCTLRCFSDDQGKMNLSIEDLQGEFLVVSQFTLYGDCTNGRRPDFFSAAAGHHAEDLYEKFISTLSHKVKHVKTGQFGADMQIALVNDGPVTLLLEA